MEEQYGQFRENFGILALHLRGCDIAHYLAITSGEVDDPLLFLWARRAWSAAWCNTALATADPRTFPVLRRSEGI